LVSRTLQLVSQIDLSMTTKSIVNNRLSGFSILKLTSLDDSCVQTMEHWSYRTLKLQNKRMCYKCFVTIPSFLLPGPSSSCLLLPLLSFIILHADISETNASSCLIISIHFLSSNFLSPYAESCSTHM
jgi:hypothetical protein